MKQIILSAFVVMCLTGCKKETAATPAAADSPAAVNVGERNIAVVQKMNAALNANNIKDAAALVADGYVDYGDGSHKPKTFKTADSVIAYYQVWHSMFPDMKSSDAEYFADKDGKVAVVSVFTGTWKGDTPDGQKATGKSFKITDCDIFTLNAEGKLTSHKYIYPDAMLNKQVGMKE